MDAETLTAMPLRFKRLSPLAILPRYHSERAAGMDLHAAIDEPVTIEPGFVARIPTGLAVAIPDGHEGQIRPRSGMAVKSAVTVVNAPGTIDADYRGPLVVALINLGKDAFVIEPKARIAQMIIAPVTRCIAAEVDELDETARGAGGFGSTGR